MMRGGEGGVLTLVGGDVGTCAVVLVVNKHITGATNTTIQHRMHRVLGLSSSQL